MFLPGGQIVAHEVEQLVPFSKMEKDMSWRKTPSALVTNI